MIAHVTLHVSDYETSKSFYETTLLPLGYVLSKDFSDASVSGFKSGEGNHDFWINADGAKQTTHVAFEARSKEEVQSFYNAALEAGGTDNGASGYREDYGPGYYAAFILDPDGHNIEAAFFES